MSLRQISLAVAATTIALAAIAAVEGASAGLGDGDTIYVDVEGDGR
jgi:hypothetical protein